MDRDVFVKVPKLVRSIASAAKDGAALVVNEDAVLGEDGCAPRIAELANGDECFVL